MAPIKDRQRKQRAARLARQPDAILIHSAVQFTTAAVFEVEGVY